MSGPCAMSTSRHDGDLRRSMLGQGPPLKELESGLDRWAADPLINLAELAGSRGAGVARVRRLNWRGDQDAFWERRSSSLRAHAARR